VGSQATTQGRQRPGGSVVVPTLPPSYASDESKRMPIKENEHKKFIFILFFPYLQIYFLIFFLLLLSGYFNNQ